MTVSVHSLAQTFLAFWDVAENKPLSEQMSLWKTHYAGRHPDVLGFYDADYGADASLEAALERYPDVMPNIRTVSAGAEVAIPAATRQCAAALGVPDAPGRHIVMVGQFASNAWADLFEGAPTCFYALELVPDTDTLVMMAAHEMTHALHYGVSDITLDDATVAETLMKEGLATSVSEVVMLGLGEEVYLWPGYDVTTEGEGVTTWLGRCRALEAELKEQLLRDLNSSDPATLGRYFNAGPRYRHERTPTRAGYAVGYWLLRRLRQSFSLSELSRWKRERINRDVAEALLTLR